MSQAGQAATIGDHAASGSPAERRTAPRSTVLKSAKLVISDTSVLNCLVLDESLTGVRVDLGAMMEVPVEVTIKFSNGAHYLAERCWISGTQAGLRFTGSQIVSADMAKRMLKMAEILSVQGIGPTMHTLRGAGFFDNEALRVVAEEAEAAYQRFVGMLEGHDG